MKDDRAGGLGVFMSVVVLVVFVMAAWSTTEELLYISATGIVICFMSASILTVWNLFRGRRK